MYVGKKKLMYTHNELVTASPLMSWSHGYTKRTLAGHTCTYCAVTFYEVSICFQLSSKPAPEEMAYSSLLRMVSTSGNIGSLRRFMHVEALGSRCSRPPDITQNGG